MARMRIRQRPPGARAGGREVLPGEWASVLAGVAALALLLCGCKPEVLEAPLLHEIAPGVAYANYRLPDVPWSIHLVRVELSRTNLGIESVHAHGTSLGLASLSEQVASLEPGLGQPVAAVNGDFFQTWGRPYAGETRGLQIAGGELLSGPSNRVCFWVDGQGRPRMGRVMSRFTVTWPDGSTNDFGLNELVHSNRLVLFTPALGWSSTGTTNAFELVLEQADPHRWLPLALGDTVAARVRELRPGGNTPITPETLVLAVEGARSWFVPAVGPGDVLRLSLITEPDLKGVRTALGGGPALIQNGRRQPTPEPMGFERMAYDLASAIERHPRTAIGWSRDHLWLALVDGRLACLSAGMTLQELAGCFEGLGCTEAMNLDGGGSATMWVQGRIRNKPSDRQERDVANGLVVVQR